MSDINMKRGDTLDNLARTFSVDGTAEDLTGATVTCEVRDQPNGNGTLIETLTVANITLTAGIIGLSATAAETDAIPVGNYYYDIKRVAASGNVLRSQTYKFNIGARVTA